MVAKSRKIVRSVVDVFSGDVIIKKGWDKYLWFIIYLFVLIIIYMIWGLFVEDRMSQVRKNEAVLKELRIEYYQKDLELTGLNEKTRIEELLLKNGNNKLHAPEEPPK
ncbi:MAG: hypothetical protein J6Z27_01635, partial [Bacteroidales bacterium]|nr:hypothetical protein [Bacteroidales bacterium]